MLWGRFYEMVRGPRGERKQHIQPNILATFACGFCQRLAKIRFVCSPTEVCRKNDEVFRTKQLLVRVYLHLLRSGLMPGLADCKVRRIRSLFRPSGPYGNKFTLNQMLRWCGGAEKLRSKRHIADCNTCPDIPEETTPHRSTVERNLVRLDVAWNNVNRAMWKNRDQSGLNCLNIAYDSSPQGGVELLNTLCRIVTCPEHGEIKFMGNVRIRLLPVVTLGHNKFMASDKFSALMHQLWLSFGPDIHEVRSACRCVRGCVTDLGTEFALVNAAVD